MVGLHAALMVGAALTAGRFPPAGVAALAALAVAVVPTAARLLSAHHRPQAEAAA